MSEPSPITDEEIFNVIELAGVESPGVVTLSGHDSIVEWDVKSASGQKGASLTKKTEKPREFTASFYLADQDDFDDWPAFRDVINSSVAGKVPKALDIYHPDLESNGFKSVVKASIAGVKHDGKGGQTYVVKFQEYAPPIASGGSPTGSASKPKTTADPNAAANAQLAALTAQYQATPWGTL